MQTEVNLKQSGIDPLTLYGMKNDSNNVANVTNVAQSIAAEHNDMEGG